MLGRRSLAATLCRHSIIRQRCAVPPIAYTIQQSISTTAYTIQQSISHTAYTIQRNKAFKLHSSYSTKPQYYRNSNDACAQPLDLDAPYPSAPAPDDYITLSFYSFFSIPTASLPALRDKIQREWSQDLSCVGRIYISDQGINAQLSVPHRHIRTLRAWLEANHTFAGRVGAFNWALEHGRAFRALHVRVRPLVAAGSDVGLDVLGMEPEYLGPAEWDRALDLAQADTLLVDMRNSYEFRVGRFSGAVCPDVDTFRDEMAHVRELCARRPRDAPVLMYCTGGIRCSVAGALLRADGLTNVKALRGGVVAYGQHARATGQSRFLGKNFTFDKRKGEGVTHDVLAACDQCGAACDTFANCAHTSCNLLFIQCDACARKFRRTCGQPLCVERAQLPHEELVKQRMPPLWSHSERVRPELVFRDGVARESPLAERYSSNIKNKDDQETPKTNVAVS
ncbi:hypothetical protein IWW50_002652 [Coemansia erecta]|nr:hypothetical protein IWW50_002652 [Coemansia erecta]